jgi:hypothetical protein
MAERHGLLLVDTDMLILLLASGMLKRVAEGLGYSPNQLRRLSAAPHQVRKSKRFRDTYGEAVLQRIGPLVTEIPEADAPTDLELLDTLNAFVDEGEAQLMALAAAQECTLLVSGDKRAVAGLIESGAAACIDSLKGKVVSLEAVLWTLVASLPAPDVRDAFKPVLSHATLRIVLSEHAVADRARCLAGIRTYYDDLHKGTRGVLFNPAPDQLGT